MYVLQCVMKKREMLVRVAHLFILYNTAFHNGIYKVCPNEPKWYRKHTQTQK